MKRVIAAILISIFVCLPCYFAIARQETAYTNSSLAKNVPSKILVLSKVLEALGKISDPKAKDVLIQGLKSKEFFIRASAAEALGRLKDKEAIASLKNLVSDENYLVQIITTRALIELGQKDMEGALLNFLNSEKPEIRANAIEQLGSFGDKYMFRLVKVLLEDKDYLVRVKAIEQLAKNKFNPAADVIRKAAKEENSQIRQAACFALGQIGDKKDIPLLKERLSDKDTSVRAATKVALYLLGERKSLIKLLWQDAESKDPSLRTSSYLVLANLKDINILPVLLKEVVAEKNQGFVRLMAARSLTILKPHVSELADEALIKSKNKPLSSENLGFNYKVSGKDLVLIFIEALDDGKNPLHEDAPLILKELKEEISLPALRETLFQNDPDLVAAVAYALGEFRDKDAVGDLIQIANQYGF